MLWGLIPSLPGPDYKQAVMGFNSTIEVTTNLEKDHSSLMVADSFTVQIWIFKEKFSFVSE